MHNCKKILTIALKGIKKYYNSETGVFSIIISNKGEYPESNLLLNTHSLISLLGISEYEEVVGIDVERCLYLIVNNLKIQNIRDSSLSLWLASKQKYGIAHSIFDKIQDLPLGNYSSMEYAWLLTGLHYYQRMSDTVVVNKMIKNVKNILIQRFNKKTNLFFHKGSHGGFRNNLATFADQIYSIYAFSESYLYDNDQQVKDILEQHSNKIISLQGPLGQWWWHYNALTGRVAGKYPVYTVHQDSMAPFAFFKFKEATGIDCFSSVQKGLSWVAGNNELNHNFLNNDKHIILRGIKKYGVLQRIQNLSSLLYGSDDFMDRAFGNRYFKLIDTEYSYHLGWILYAFNKRNLSFWSED